MAINRRRFLQNTSVLASALALGACGGELIKGPAGRGKVDLLGSYWTIAGGAIPHAGPEYSPFDFRDRVEALSRGGFTGMGIWHADLEHILKSYSHADMKRILDDNGIEHLELEFLLNWFVYGDKRRESDEQRKLLLTAAEKLGARHVKVGDFYNTEVDMDQLIREWGILCDDGANAGALILFEAMPFAMVSTMEDTLTMLEGANRNNGGIIMDTWHMAKMGVSNDYIANFPSRYLLGVEINDGYLKTPDGLTMGEEAYKARLFPGEGEFDVEGFVDAVQRNGYDGPWGVEVLNTEYRKWPLKRLVNHSYDTAMKVITA
ncbi:MAG: sugar phosphate isomerase/epimerase [Gammaproteobacteria bacterium]